MSERNFPRRWVHKDKGRGSGKSHVMFAFFNHVEMSMAGSRRGHVVLQDMDVCGMWGPWAHF